MTIFITGATGFLGSYLLKALLEQHQPVVALVRPHKVPPIERIKASLSCCGSSHHIQALASQLVRCIEGDISQQYFGLSLPEFRSLADNISSVWHLAGTIDLGANSQRTEATNLRGIKHILEFLNFNPTAQFCHVSTTFVAGKRTGTIYEEELLHHLGFENPYEASKYHAEFLIRFWAELHQRQVTIFRPSIITDTPSSSKTHRHTLATLAHIWTIALSKLPKQVLEKASARLPADSNAYLNIVPVNYVVQSMITIARQSMPALISTYHIVNPVDVSLLTLLESFSQLLGVWLYPYPHTLTDPSPIEKLLVKSGQAFLPYLFQRRRFDDSQLRVVIPPTIHCPEVTKFYLVASISEFGSRLIYN
ncbi:thioester reductase domain-containing protein [Calothrix sp. NIES-4071]|nr:thioester reductase domain-containing protein [Calothrix sp. NIES-4071]BAZ57032.1 thioester reductase domain-containing protein [Calothrix sp. NIES-4105]